MRDPIENVTRLQKQLNNLQLENQVLKNILDKAGLSYQNELASIRKKDTKEDFDPEQGKRIVYPKEITDRMAKLFFSFFWGRTDVYAKRNVNKNGEAAYYPQCDNFWSDNCHRKLNTHIDCKDCKYCSYTRLDLSTILMHLRGNSYAAKDVIGVYPLFSDGTGSLVGEGFDFPRLDTLFMATPVSFRGVVEQYAGRLNRDYAGKENVIIYDYVDNHITMFNNMYMKRLKAYKQIGYEIAGGLHNDKQTANAIYDGDNYAENYHKDLLDANKNIIISSPAISGTKVYELINLLKEKQLSGVQITIVTWAPDSYGFGDAAYWMQLHEEMRKAGFYIKTVEESCERFAVIDQEVVWYGNINLLAKDKVDDSIMRVLSKEIASELMEITFGDNG